jgi:predicted dehydrogenase
VKTDVADDIMAVFAVTPAESVNPLKDPRPMPARRPTRRRFLQASSAAWGAALLAGSAGRARGFETPNERPRIGVIGCGSRWDQRATGITGRYGLGKEFPKFGDITHVCDVDSERTARAQGLVKEWGGSVPEATGDYRKLIDNQDIDIIHCSTPDHWHAKVLIEAMLAGKDVYCEKPMTLTIAEGRQICDVAANTKRVVQIGTQQRSDPKMLTAIALIRAGRLGKIKQVSVGIGGAPTSPVIEAVDPPKHFDWDRWQGPVAETAYLYKAGNPRSESKSWSRTHYEFRWWYEYSGGKLTDWGAHHVDIATWGMDKTNTGPISIDPLMAKHPVEFKDGMPVERDRYNTAKAFHINATYTDGVQLTIRHDLDNGILFEGTEGRIFVNRGRLTGKPAEELADHPLPDGAVEAVYKNRPLTDHARNFFEAVQSRKEPVSDVFSHHRALSTCHLAGIAARLGRKIQWDPKTEQVLGDPQANAMVSRDKRQGYEIEI